MKKNTVMRMLSLVLVLTLISTCAISGTFAKYTTQDSAGDAARVAKWGVELQVAGNLYGYHYGTGSVAPTATTNVNEATVTVATIPGDDLVAPGTKSDTGLAFSINGKPEVSSSIVATITHENIYLKSGEYGVMVKLGKIGKVEFDAIMAEGDAHDRLFKASGTDFVAVGASEAHSADTEYYTLEDYVNLASNYYPVEYALAGTTTNYNTAFDAALTENTLATIAGKIGDNFGGATTSYSDGKATITYDAKVVAPNKDLAAELKLQDEVLTWKWDFCQSDTQCADGNAACDNCKADTILGNLMAGAALNGTVVKLDGTTWKAPTEAAGDTADPGDYNLQTEFSINITVTQVD